MTMKEQSGDDAVSGGANEAAKISAMLDQLWIRFLPEIHSRVDTLEAAAAACAAKELSPEMRANAHTTAHKLAGTLGMFGLAHGTDLAREFEVEFGMEAEPDSALGERITALAIELRRIVESRG